MTILFQTYQSERHKLPEGRRYQRPAYALAAALLTTLNNASLYARVLKTLGLLLPWLLVWNTGAGPALFYPNAR